MLKIVVSRYNENLHWLHIFDADDLVIYNKGNDDLPNATKLENIGREGLTYVQYILKHYDELPDFVFFTQGRIEDHTSVMNVFATINDIKAGKQSPGYLGLNTSRGSGGNGDIVGFHDGTHPGLPIKEVWDALFAATTNSFKCNYCGIFIASKERILFRSKEFYETIEEFLKKDPIYGFVIERLWSVIFDGTTLALL